jgi:beta-mannosidase
VALYQDWEALVAEAQEELELAAHGSVQRTVEGLLGRFVDAGAAYGFGPPAQDVIVATLESGVQQGELLSQGFRFPAGRPLFREPAERIGIEVSAQPDAGGKVALTIGSRRLAYGVRVQAPGFLPDDDAFAIEPRGKRVVRLAPTEPGAEFSGGSISALNLFNPVSIGPLST